ncbi:hypothetical protein IB286_04345 [Spongiibacter sp. KMU-158]|uniref:Uncharacterized protein n=1 Tax=Spongiibacter pelagi TaxID=2760804 RepID=A0A927GWA5_9GAMM|nr:hypothetical protein [Spongiibacter pelagi]MBD2858229.1 hypothetical protein [Spongiibacter pelagi]
MSVANKAKGLKNVLATISLSVCAVSFAIAEPTGEIKSEAGFEDPASGARVETVDKSFWTGKTRVLVSIPAGDGKEALEVEEVLVTAKRPEKPEGNQTLRYKFVKDYSDDRYGMYIYLDKNSDMPFRIYFKDTPSDERFNRGL